MNPKRASLIVAAVLAGCVSASTVPWQENVEHNRPVAHIAELLRHHPGVSVVGVGREMKLFVRGSLYEPLVILDGMALPPNSRGALAEINPSDVAYIRVLTDPTDLTFYGLRGANGVIVITTKRR